jgi:hypothetical protein
MPLHAADRPPTARVPVPARAAGSLVRDPRLDHSEPASAAEVLCIAWASVDALHDGPDTYVARCARLATASQDQQLAACQPATAACQANRHDREVSLVRVRAVTRPDGAPALTPAVAYLRVHATRAAATASRTTGSDGATVQLTRSGGHWLVSRPLFC